MRGSRIIILDDCTTVLADQTGCVTGILSSKDLLSDGRLLDRVRQRVREATARTKGEAADVRARQASLSSREREVMDRLVSGKHTKAIAREMGISPKTVEFHRTNVLRKMGVDSVVGLVRILLTRATGCSASGGAATFPPCPFCEEHRQAQAVLNQRTDELQAICDGMVDGLLIADAETKRFVRANCAICRMLGYSEEELLCKSVLDIHPTDNLSHVLETFQAQTEGRLPFSECVPVQRKDGSIFFADIASKQIVYHQRPCAIKFFRETTERRMMEEALRRERD